MGLSLESPVPNQLRLVLGAFVLFCFPLSQRSETFRLRAVEGRDVFIYAGLFDKYILIDLGDATTLFNILVRGYQTGKEANEPVPERWTRA